jgi:RNA polymerase sigma-70 factor (ECF subfamily)
MALNLFRMGRFEREPESTGRDKMLVARVRQGDPAALDQLYCLYRDDLGWYVRSIVRSREAAEEIIQDLFLRLWQHRDRWEFEGEPRAYLFRAARNRSVSFLRSQRVELRLHREVARDREIEPRAPAAPAGDQRAEAADLMRVVSDVVSRLPPRCQEVFRLSRQHHLKYAEIARVMGISTKTVEVQLRRALLALRAELRALGLPGRPGEDSGGR